MHALLERRAAETPDRPFAIYAESGEEYSYASFNRAVNRLAHGLIELGVVRGNIVAVTLTTCPEYQILSYALLKIGAIEAGVNGEYDEPKIGEQYATLRPDWYFVSRQFLDKVELIVRSRGGVSRLVVVDSSDDSGGVLRIEDLFVEQDHNPGEQNDDPLSTAMIMMSSGTTGLSKALQISHRQAYAYSHGLCEAYAFTPSDRVYICWPMFHATGSICDLFTALYAGASAVLTRRFSARAFWPHVRGYGVTWASSLGVLQKILWNACPSGDDRNHGMRLMWGGPHPIERDLFRERFGIECSLGYGMSEIGLVNFQQPHDPEDSFGRVRRDTYDVKIVDAKGRTLPPGEHGQIVVREKYPGVITRGYLNRPDLNEQIRENDWFHTGDVGWLDGDNQLYYVERMDSVIRHKGNLIPPAEVEKLLEGHPAVNIAAVIGLASELGDCDIAAVVELHQDTVATEAELLDHCRSRAPNWMVPSTLRLVNRVPLTGTGKPVYGELENLLREDNPEE